MYLLQVSPVEGFVCVQGCLSVVVVFLMVLGGLNLLSVSLSPSLSLSLSLSEWLCYSFCVYVALLFYCYWLLHKKQ